jgi:hypothetical protein
MIRTDTRRDNDHAEPPGREFARFVYADREYSLRAAPDAWFDRQPDSGADAVNRYLDAGCMMFPDWLAADELAKAIAAGLLYVMQREWKGGGHVE